MAVKKKSVKKKASAAGSRKSKQAVKNLVKENMRNSGAAGCVKVCIDACREAAVQDLVRENMGSSKMAGCVRVCMDTCREVSREGEDLVKGLVKNNMSGYVAAGCVRVCMDTCREVSSKEGDNLRPVWVKQAPRQWLGTAQRLDYIAERARSEGAFELYEYLRRAATLASLHAEKLACQPASPVTKAGSGK